MALFILNDTAVAGRLTTVLLMLLVFGYPFSAYSCPRVVCGNATVCVDGICSPQQVCWVEEYGGICDGEGPGPPDPGLPPGGGGDGGFDSPWDANNDGRMDCWTGTTLNPSIPPATGPYGQLADRFHYGADITSGTANYGKGNPVLALARGTVAAAGYTEANGNYVKINHDDGRSSYYLHLLELDGTMIVGARTVPAQMVGSMNCTGNCYGGGIRGADRGTHLHLEIRTTHTAGRAADGSTTIDPTTYSNTYP